MAYEIVVTEVTARPLAAVRARVSAGSVAAAWRPALDQVWAFLRRHDGVWTDGHNIFVYHHPARPGSAMDVAFGVEVSRPFEHEGEIVFSHTPAGIAASTIHVGPPDQLALANSAIEAWCRANDRALSGVSWEIYGDTGDDPAAFEVAVYYLLA